jgi:hypothetical protein
MGYADPLPLFFVTGAGTTVVIPSGAMRLRGVGLPHVRLDRHAPKARPKDGRLSAPSRGLAMADFHLCSQSFDLVRLEVTFFLF